MFSCNYHLEKPRKPTNTSDSVHHRFPSEAYFIFDPSLAPVFLPRPRRRCPGLWPESTLSPEYRSSPQPGAVSGTSCEHKHSQAVLCRVTPSSSKTGRTPSFQESPEPRRSSRSVQSDPCHPATCTLSAARAGRRRIRRPSGSRLCGSP